MGIPKCEYIWMNGQKVKWDDAKIHVLSHVVHYGSSVFEGMRVYNTPNGPAAFRLQEHTTRLFDSAKIYRMDIPFTEDEINAAILDLVSANKLESCYVRPVVYRGYDTLGVDPANCPIDVCLAAWPWGRYLGNEAMEQGVSVCVSTWSRFAPNTMPAMAKSGSNYANGQLIKMEAIRLGFSEGICLDTNGHVSEGSGENVFLVRDGVLITPDLGSSVLSGITRDSVMKIARDMGIEVREQAVPREMLYLVDEVFFSGSAAEVTPISQIDHLKIGSGRRGPITEKIQKAFFEIVTGVAKDRYGWLTMVPLSKEETLK